VTLPVLWTHPLRWLKVLFSRRSRRSSPTDTAIRSLILPSETLVISASGERALVDTGTITDSTIVYGSMEVYEGGAVSHALFSFDDFSAWLKRLPVLSYDGALVGRGQQLEQIRQFLCGEGRVLFVLGPHGIGKTRILLALPNVIPSGTHLWYVSAEASAAAIEQAIAGLSREERHVLVVDDAHRLGSRLDQVREALVEPTLAGKIQVVYAASNVYKKDLLAALPPLGRKELCSIELGLLAPSDINALLQSPPCDIQSEKVRFTLIPIAQGNPLIAVIAADLVRQGLSLSDVSHDEVLTRYLDQVVHELEANSAISLAKISAYLAVVSALGTIELGDVKLRGQVQSVTELSPVEEEHLIAYLVGAGYAERFMGILKLSFEVLSDYLFVDYFFRPSIHKGDYRAMILRPFFDQHVKQRDILTVLARAAVKGERAAGALLDQVLDELRTSILKQGIHQCYTVLSWLDDVALLHPSGVLSLIAPVIEEQAQPTEQIPNEFDTHAHVLGRVVALLSYAIVYGDPVVCIAYLQRLAGYHLEDAHYTDARNMAANVLVGLAQFKLGRPYAIHLELVRVVKQWLVDDFEVWFDLCLKIVRPMLELRFEQSWPSLVAMAVIIEHGLIKPGESLARIREEVLKVLFSAYLQAKTLRQRISIVDGLEGALPQLRPGESLADDDLSWLRPNGVETAQFLLTEVVPTAELPVLEAVYDWLWRARRFSGYRLGEWERLRQALAAHRLYQLYRVLVGKMWLNEADDTLDYKAGEQYRYSVIDEVLGGLTAENIDQTITDLTKVAEQALAAGQMNTYWLETLLKGIGERVPELACRLIDRSTQEHLALINYLGNAIAGLRKAEPDLALKYVVAWTETDDEVLNLNVAKSYRAAAWEKLSEPEWDVLALLVDKQRIEVDQLVALLVPSFASYRPELAITLLKTLAHRGDSTVVRQVAVAASWPGTSSPWAVGFLRWQDLLEICMCLVPIPQLDHDMQTCLIRLGQMDPLLFVEILERCVRYRVRLGEQEMAYEPIPFDWLRAADQVSFQQDARYYEALRRVRDWMLSDDEALCEAVSDVLAVLASGLNSPLVAVLQEWVLSGDHRKWLAVAEILRTFNSGDAFYALSRELVIRAAAEENADTIATIRGAMWLPKSGLWQAETAGFLEDRIAALASWREDDNPHLRSFGNELSQQLRLALDSERMGMGFPDFFGGLKVED
jgi:hypothetical protein